MAVRTGVRCKAVRDGVCLEVQVVGGVLQPADARVVEGEVLAARSVPPDTATRQGWGHKGEVTRVRSQGWGTGGPLGASWHGHKTTAVKNTLN